MSELVVVGLIAVVEEGVLEDVIRWGKNESGFTSSTTELELGRKERYPDSTSSRRGSSRVASINIISTIMLPRENEATNNELSSHFKRTAMVCARVYAKSVSRLLVAKLVS